MPMNWNITKGCGCTGGSGSGGGTPPPDPPDVSFYFSNGGSALAGAMSFGMADTSTGHMSSIAGDSLSFTFG